MLFRSTGRCSSFKWKQCLSLLVRSVSLGRLCSPIWDDSSVQQSLHLSAPQVFNKQTNKGFLRGYPSKAQHRRSKQNPTTQSSPMPQLHPSRLLGLRCFASGEIRAEEPSSGENGGQCFSTDGEPAGAEMEGKLKGKYGSLQRERRTAFSTAKEK